MSTNNTPIENPSDREIVSTRLFAISREKVFNAFADPKQLAQWWGPNDVLLNTIEEFDLRAGGSWRLIMHAPNGTDYHGNQSEFTDVVRPERIVYRHFWSRCTASR